MFDNYKKKRRKREEKEKDYENIKNLFRQVNNLEKIKNSMLQTNEKIKIIRSKSENDFSVQYSSTMKILKEKERLNYILDNIWNVREDRIQYNGEDFILVIKYTMCELKNDVNIDDYKTVEKDFKHYYKLYSNANNEYYNKYGEEW